VDLRLDISTLRSAADLCAVLAAAGEAGSVRTLTLGPWGGNEDADPGSAVPCDSADAALRAFFICSSIWSTWSLRSFAFVELGAVDASNIVLALSSMPRGPGLSTLKLVSLGLGTAGVEACAAALRTRHRCEPLHLDLSSNSLGDESVKALLPLLDATEASTPPIVVGLNVSGNPHITVIGLQRLLAAPGALLGLQALDLSECSLGPSGAQILASHLSAFGCALRDLTAYRCGLGVDGVLLLVAAASSAPFLRSLSLVANGQHSQSWLASVGATVARALSAPPPGRAGGRQRARRGPAAARHPGSQPAE